MSHKHWFISQFDFNVNVLYMLLYAHTNMRNPLPTHMHARYPTPPLLLYYSRFANVEQRKFGLDMLCKEI